MSFSVETIPLFEREVKRLRRKHPSLKKDLIRLVESLESNPAQGTGLGNNFYKIGLAITSKAKGKSGGARVITLVKVLQQKVYLSAIYDKNEQNDISDKELKLIADYISKLM